MHYYKINQNNLFLNNYITEDFLAYLEDIGQSRAQKIEEALKKKTYLKYFIKKLGNLSSKDNRYHSLLIRLKEDLDYIDKNYKITKK